MDCLTLTQRKLIFCCSEECKRIDPSDKEDQIKNLSKQKAEAKEHNKKCSELEADIRAKEAEIGELNTQTDDYFATIQEMKTSIETLTVENEQHILEIKDLKNENFKLSQAPTAVFQDNRDALYTKLYNDLSGVFNAKFSALEALVKRSCSSNSTNNNTVTKCATSANNNNITNNKKFNAPTSTAMHQSNAEMLPTNRRNSRKFSAITSTKATNSAGISAAAILPKTAIFVRKLSNDVSKDNLRYLHDVFDNEEEFTLGELNSKSEDYKCFKIVANNDLETSILDPKNWPIDVEIKKFQFFRHNRSNHSAILGPRIFRHKGRLNQRNY
ncbi:unnamed protein product [Ceutorhynchus assimilis]|uniref:Uncharacterized protein n=1 Tax=Ceutorhynchus assimilis TaxID=467358 RepID=A0A9N9QK95_9CUCU|nr:unnamed protein product [Ceutorhynchus assimilis]